MYRKSVLEHITYRYPPMPFLIHLPPSRTLMEQVQINSLDRISIQTTDSQTQSHVDLLSSIFWQFQLFFTIRVATHMPNGIIMINYYSLIRFLPSCRRRPREFTPFVTHLHGGRHFSLLLTYGLLAGNCQIPKLREITRNFPKSLGA